MLNFNTYETNDPTTTFATRCFEAGIKPKTVQSYLGHATLQMTMDLYTSVLPQHQMSEMDKLENALDDINNSSDKLVDEQYELSRQNQPQNVINFGDRMVAN